FVGGNVTGSLKTRESSVVWIDGTFGGDIECGPFHTMMQVGMDCPGEITLLKRSILSLNVQGFMPFQSLERIAAAGATLFRGSIGISDHPAGLYPDCASYRTRAQEGSYNYWVIIRQRDATDL